jgi:predicted ATPase
LRGDPTLDALPETRSNLPVQPTPLIGRERELREVLGLLSDNRLLTLTGAGGIGKTRLAYAAAAKIVGSFRDGVWFVSLAALHDPNLVLPTVAETLGVKEPETIEQYLRQREALLVLDNFEQLLDAAPSVAQLLRGAPRLRLLVTSRASLHLSGEQEYLVPTLSDESAVRLFVERARAAQAAFAEDEHIVEICRLLDNLPLALELAAARVKVVTAETLLARLEKRLPLLIGGRADLPERQRTMRATIEWSHGLLTSEEQRLFARLGVFVGGCTLQAAEEVADAELNTLQSLVDKNLLQQTGEGRFSMLETVREFCLDLLQTDERDGLRGRHARFFASLIRRPPGTLQALATPAGRGLRERVAPDVANVRAAVEWALAADEIELALDIAHEAGAVPVSPREVADWFDRALQREDSIPAAAAARAYRDAAGTLYLSLGHVSEARRLCERSVVLYRELGDLRGEATALSTLGQVLVGAGRPHEARHCLRRALAIADEHHFDEMIAPVLNNLGLLERDVGETERAAELFAKSITLARAAGNLGAVGAALHSLADLLLDRGDVRGAEARYVEATAVARDLLDKRLSMYCLGGLAATAARRGHVDGAGRNWGAALAIEKTYGWQLFGSDRLRYERALTEVAGMEFEAASARGQAIPFEAAIDLALTDLGQPPSGTRAPSSGV